ncbi:MULTISPECIES: Mrp/NBP35 family ATP-binding protein [unclassified Chelatococcus]|uniref:Mrp/NBP35 family ATP-binding protein n=1 Tax=unclassified Chelatococcus TaxID=2638111 RepID=UPI001BD1A234|nr:MULTISPECIES: Mrp/NBP35 family ATP-binding protein [unclassified Chelatococcus]CAH1670040.1 Iron-sulfur cluster carrier protein [Hyphomicrobiales bacterium]MBS7739257.1 Mrp/NBP35 family ATP-binding protein [Chelatococcus sp. HY11]MBX3546536.1 Mrp/NBP35 family ATP-binding protein [Chelatococcus sp.]MCO5076210.1 Mrp/NBP35 family ATP-binding protein [Chelatococcus sp.]CAH1678518.1 Iron-sulfur cluster carrier protein [Hyphomicrobiales bacterium]
MITRDAIVARLNTIAGPDGTTPLGRSAALSEVVIAGGKVYFSIAIDPARSQEFEALRHRAEGLVREMPGVESVIVTLTAEAAPSRAEAPRSSARPAAPVGGERPLGPKASSQTKAGIPGVKHIVAVASGKGGVGKSTVACNLALALARQGLKVGLLDADIYGPSLPKLLALSDKPEVIPGRRILRPLVAHGLKVMSIGFLVDEQAAMIWRGPMVMSAIQQMLREVEWGELDVLIVDMPPGTGDAQLTMAQNAALAGVVIVSTPQDLALIDARRGVAMFRRVEVPILGVVENMSSFICPHCGGRSDIFGHGGARDEAQAMGVPFLGEVPLTMALRAASDEGEPIVVRDPHGPEASVFMDIAAQLTGALGGASRLRPAPRIVIE